MTDNESENIMMDKKNRQSFWNFNKAILFFLLGLFCLFLQAADKPIWEEKPFVSKLRASEDKGIVHLKWTVSEHLEEGSYVIFRHTEEITVDNFDDEMKVGEVQHPEFSFDDQIKKAGKYYYLVLSRSQRGKLNEIFIPYRNKTIFPLKVGQAAAVPSSTPSPSPGPTPENSPTPSIGNSYDISHFEAEYTKEGVVLRFTSREPDSTFSLFRSDNEITSLSQVRKKQPLNLLLGSEKEYIDAQVSSERTYYYALLDTIKVRNNEAEIIPGKNTVSVETVLDGESYFKINKLRPDSLEKALTLSFEAENPDGRIIIFRSQAKITEDNIESAQKIANIPSSRKFYSDETVEAGKEYFYCLQDETRSKTGKWRIIYGENATALAMRLKEVQSTVAPVSWAKVYSIRTESKKGSILVHFKCDDPDVQLNIYRRPILPIQYPGDLESSKKIAEIKSDQNVFVDSPLIGVEYFYLVGDSRFVKSVDFLVRPGENASISPAINKAESEIEIPSLTPSPSPSPSSEPEGRYLRVEAGEDYISLKFNQPDIQGNLLIFRSTFPLQSWEALKTAERIASLPSGSREYQDAPPSSDQGFYYALCSQASYQRGEFQAVPGENTSLQPLKAGYSISLHRKSYLERKGKRPYPIPDSPVLEDRPDYSHDQERSAGNENKLSPKQERKIERLLGEEGYRGSPALAKPRYLNPPSDSQSSEYQELKQILEAEIKRGDWQKAEKRLNQMMKKNYGREFMARLYYYRGQCRLFQGDFQNAFYDFLYSREFFNSESKYWMDQILDRMSESNLR